MKIIKETSRTIIYKYDYNKIKFNKLKDGKLELKDAFKTPLFVCEKDKVLESCKKWESENKYPNGCTQNIDYYLERKKSDFRRFKKIELRDKREQLFKKLDIKEGDIITLYKGSGGSYGRQLKLFLVESVGNVVVGWYCYVDENIEPIKCYYTHQEFFNIKGIYKRE